MDRRRNRFWVERRERVDWQKKKKVLGEKEREEEKVLDEKERKRMWRKRRFGRGREEREELKVELKVLGEGEKISRSTCLGDIANYL